MVFGSLVQLPDLNALAEIDRAFPLMSPRSIALMVQFAGHRRRSVSANARALARAAGPADTVDLLEAWEGDLPRLIESMADGEGAPLEIDLRQGELDDIRLPQTRS